MRAFAIFAIEVLFTFALSMVIISNMLLKAP